MHVYLHQIHTLHSSGAAPALFDAVEADYLPLAQRFDIRLVGYWQTSAIQGRTGEAVAVWEYDDYRHLERFNRALYGTDDDGRSLRAWREREQEWVAHTDGMVCEPAESSPTVAQLQERNVRGAMCTHEIVMCKPYRHIEYPQLLTEMWTNRFADNADHPKNRTTVGLYYAKWSNTIAVNIWSDGVDWDDVTIWEPAWEQDPGFELWNTLGREIRDDFTDRFLLPAPFSTVR
jgi:hypothetical protein